MPVGLSLQKDRPPAMARSYETKIKLGKLNQQKSSKDRFLQNGIRYRLAFTRRCFRITDPYMSDLWLTPI